MKKTIKALKLTVTFLGMAASFIACDKDFSAIDSNVLGKDNANFNTGVEHVPITAYNKKSEALQINGLASNLLGVFNDPSYGLTTASIVTQITPTSFSPAFGDNPEIDSVILNIPYFNKAVEFDDDGYEVYALDSLYGNTDESIKLSIYQNNYFLRSFNPDNTEENQRYYSNANTGNLTDNLIFNGSTAVNIDDHKGGLIFEDDDFVPSSEAIITVKKTETDTTVTRSEPALRVTLNADFWKSAIIDKEDDVVLSNSSNFQNYFRGLYFKAEALSNDGSMILLNLNSTNANIIIYYSKDSTTEGERTQSTYTLNFTGNILNTFINNYDKEVLENGDNTLGDEKLFLKGAEGSMAIVDLFSGLVDCDGDGEVDDDPLECFKNTYRATDNEGKYIVERTTGDFVLKRLINEAQLEVYEHGDIIAPDDDFHKYDRIYAYDIKNNTPLVDYYIDPTDNTNTPFNSKIIHLSQRDTITKKYKIRITEHLNNILKKDSTNTRIGLVLSTNVNYVTNSRLLNSNDGLTAVPGASILMPRGTILYGSNANVDDNKIMTLSIYYTQPN